ncbi:hypothetical protein AeNC1_017846 [Aphanomyces euteiches]|nr:hypothetical protein AeNC1_017846 [Aphanomyces euteiches]
MEIPADDKFFQRVLDRCFVVANPALLVLSHNDLSAKNVLKLAHAVQIIDFDGSNRSYRGADIGYMAKNLEMHGMSMDDAALHRFVAKTSWRFLGPRTPVVSVRPKVVFNAISSEGSDCHLHSSCKFDNNFEQSCTEYFYAM